MRAPISDREQISLLQEEILWLRSELGILIDAEQLAEVRLAFAMTPTEARLMLVLINSSLVTTDSAMLAFSSAGYDYDAQEKIVDVIICKVRAKLKRKGIAEAVDTIWGTGWRLSVDGRRSVALALSQPVAS